MVETPSETAGLTLLGDNEAEFRGIESFPCPKGVHRIRLTSDEVSALCPVTSQPDWYEVEIELIGPRLAIESKSLKLYLQSFRNTGIFCEDLASQIAADVKFVAGGRVVVVITQKPRGGIAITAIASKGDE